MRLTGPILTAAAMKAAEQACFATGVDEYAVMERAGAAAAEIIWRAGHGRDTLILCGPGNNGGDGFVIARLLRDRGVAVRVAAIGDSRTPSSQRARAAWAGPVEPLEGTAPATQLIDALFGIGLARGVDTALAARLAALADGATMVHAVDLPSGVDTDSGALLSPVPRYDVTIALGALKPAHVLQPAAGCMGRIMLADIGVPVDGQIRALDPPMIGAPGVQDHKYGRGLVQVLSGDMAGAAALAATAAAHGGAGMVRLGHVSATIAEPHAIVRQNDADLSDARIAALLIGPGLGRGGTAQDIFRRAIAAGHPMVIDADALTLVAEGSAMLPSGAILTPHEGEFVRLFGDLPGSKIDRALAAATRAQGVVVYKGADTVIAAPDGRAAVLTRSSPWLSTAGTGDVLAGLIAARLAVTGDPFVAACQGVWLHADAARRAGPAFIADDLLAALPAAIAARL